MRGHDPKQQTLSAGSAEPWALGADPHAWLQPGRGGITLLCFLAKITVPFLRKTFGAGLAAGPNVVGSGNQVRSKTLSKGATNVE